MHHTNLNKKKTLTLLNYPASIRLYTADHIRLDFSDRRLLNPAGPSAN